MLSVSASNETHSCAREPPVSRVISSQVPMGRGPAPGSACLTESPHDSSGSTSVAS